MALRSEKSVIEETPQAAPVKNSSSEGFWASVGIGLLVALLVAGFVFRGHVAPVLGHIEAAVNRSGSLGPVVYTAACAVWAVLCLPGPMILTAGGTLFASQPWIAVAGASFGDLVAQAVGFLLARGLARDRVRRRVGHHAWFQWLEAQTKRHGAMRVAIIRLMPFFPNSLANYAFGLTAVDFWPYLAASWLGSLPSLALYIGGVAGAVHVLRDGNWQHALWLVAGLLVAIVAIRLIVSRAVPDRLQAN